jgi:DNA polymerase (family 10)
MLQEPAMLSANAADVVAAVEEFLLGVAGVRRAEVVGDYRRGVEVITELRFLVDAERFDAVITSLQQFGGRSPVIAAASSTVTVVLPAGLPLRVHRARPDEWGAAQIATTGSLGHLRRLTAVTGPLPGLVRAGTPSRSETELYRRFGMTLIAPELREGRDEIELARADALPALVTMADIRGELHAHTTSSDGSHSLEAMAIAARDRGYQYLGITDHSPRLKMVRGLSVDALRAQLRQIDELNRRLSPFRVLKAAEVDILEDGTLDYPDEVLRELDYAVCSIHTVFNLDESAQTERMLRAMSNPHCAILGHPTGRLLLRRPGYPLDLERIIDRARETGCVLEINASPDRLDLSAEHARLAAAAGVRIAISADAHSVGELDFTRHGVLQARRAGLEPADIVNCRPVNELLPLRNRDR